MTPRRGRIDSTILRRSLPPERRQAFADRWVREILDELAAALMEDGALRNSESRERCRAILVGLAWNRTTARPLIEGMLVESSEAEDSDAVALAAGGLAVGVPYEGAVAWLSRRTDSPEALDAFRYLLSPADQG